MSPYEELRLLVGSLGEFETRKERCPFCHGGRTGEISLSITRFEAGSGAYQCKRASCAKEGWIGERYGTHLKPVVQQKEWEPRIYDGTIEELPDERRRELADKYGWTEEAVSAACLGWSPEYRRSIWEIRSPTGTRRGIELRSLNPAARSKTLHFRHSADTWVGYVDCREVQGSPPGRGGCLVAVEDLVSAYRVAEIYPAASIMGSHLTFETLCDLMKVSDKIVLCLDRDATEKAEKFARRFSFLCPDFVHIPITRDLKYEQPEKIKEIIQPAL